MKSVLSLILLASAIVCAQDKTVTKALPPDQTQTNAQPAPVKTPPAAPAMQVYRDPVTGEMGGPPPSSAGSATASSNQATTPESIGATQEADGSFSAVLPESSQMQLTVTR